MKPFALDAVLTYRQQLEDTARQKLFTLQRQEAELQKTLRNAGNRLQDLYSDLETERRRGVTAQRLILFEETILSVQQQISDLEEELASLRKDLDRQQRQLLKKSQDRKVLEKLRQKQNLNYQQYLAGKEAAMLDELAIIFHDR